MERDEVVRGFAVGGTDGCCGVQQIMNFGPDEPEWATEYEASGATEKEAYDNLFKDFDELEKGYIYQIWFVKRSTHDGFERNFVAPRLRTLVRGMAGVKKLGRIVNPNSGNIIEGYQWIAK